MSIEDLDNNINRDEIPVSSEAEMRQKLASAVATISNLRRSSEQKNRLGSGSTEPERVLLGNIPTIGYIVDGDISLRRKDYQDSTIIDRVNSLPIELVIDTQDKIDGFLLTIIATSSVTAVKRLAPYLTYVMPVTKEGYEALRFISRGYQVTYGLPNSEQLTKGIDETIRLLDVLDDTTLATAGGDKDLLQDLYDDAKERAKLKLPELLSEDSDQVRILRTTVAGQKIAQLRREPVEVQGTHGYSKFEVLANEIIEQEGLNEQTEAAKEIERIAQEKAKDVVLTAIARKRALKKVMAMIEENPLLCQVLAQRQRMTSEELLNAEDSVKRTVANNALGGTKTIIISEEERKIFNGARIEANERKLVEQDLPDLQDPSLADKLPDDELIIIRNGIPKTSDRKSVFNLARERLRQKIEDEVTEDELLEALTQRTVKELLSERCTVAVDLAIKSLGIEAESLLKDSTILVRSADVIVPQAIQNLRSNKTSQIEPSVVKVEKEQPEKPYIYEIPLVTIGKSQLVSPYNLLRYGTTVTLAASPEQLALEVQRLIDSSEEFQNYFSSTEYKQSRESEEGLAPLGAVDFYPPEKKAEMLYSMVGRGAGSKLAGTPLFELQQDLRGIIATLDPSMDKVLEARVRYGSRLITNSVRLSPLLARIGQPYCDRLVKATRLVADTVDTVAGNLLAVIEGSDRASIAVEEVTNYVKQNLNSLLNETYGGSVPGRSVLQMDYFLLYPPEVRKAILDTYRQTGSIDNLMPLLSSYTAEGNMKMTIFDISGGSGGVGISEILSERLLGRESGHMRAYLDALLESYEIRIGKMPERVLLVPREADLTLMNFEYTIVEEALKARGIPTVGITTLEMLQQSLEVARRRGNRLQVPTLKGEVIDPELIIKRYTFPNEGKGIGYRGDILTRLPDGVILEPNNSSRIIASDKRVNSPILGVLEPQLQELGVEVMPYLDLDIQGRNLEEISEAVVRFMKDNREAYPEIDYLGAVLKTGDKIPGREGSAGEVISAYPVPASVIDNPEMQRLFIAKKIRELALKGVTGVILQPNVLSLVVDNNGMLMPKYELKMMAFANQRK